MANRYWVGGSGNWGDAANHWAASSGGSANASNLPTIEDNVYFDANSFDASGTITLDISANCKNFDWTGLDSSVWLTSSVQSAYIYGDVSLNSNLNWVFTGTAYVYLWGLDTSRYIYSNNSYININRIYMEASGATYVNVDDWAVNNTGFYLSQGTWDTNSKTIRTTSNYNNINTTVGNLIGTKKLSLGSSDFYCNTFFESGSSSGFTLDASNSTIYCIYVYSYWQRSYNNIVITPNTAQAGLYSFRDTQNYNNVTFTPTTKTTLIIIGNHNINNLLTLHGNDSSLNRLFIISSVTASTRYIYSSDVSCSNIDFADISVGGTANWDLSNIPGGSGDCGGNTGITFTPSTSCYFVHTSGTCYWSDASKWMTTSGGNIPARVPLPQDDVTFDENSFTGDSTLIGNCMRLGKNINMKAVDVSLLFDLRQLSDCYGDYILNSNISRTGKYRTNLMGRDKNYIVDVSGTSVYGFQIYGNYTAMSDLIIHNHISTREGCVFDANDFDIRKIDPTVTWEWMTLDGSVKMGNGTWEFNLGQIYTTRLMDTGKGIFQIDPEGSTIKFNPPASESRNLEIYLRDNPNVRLNRLHLSGKHTGNYRFVYQGAHINELIIDPGRKVQFLDSRIYRIYNRLVASGTPDASIYIGNTNLTIPFILDSSSSSARIQVDYCYIQRSRAIPNNRWYARNSVDLGNNTGWIFKEYNLKPIRVGNTILDKFIEKE